MKNLIRVLSILVILTMVQSCSDLLQDPEPSTAVSQEVALGDPGAVSAVRANMYSRLHSFDYTTEYMLGPEALADNLGNATNSTRFIGYTQNSIGTGMESWSTSYDMINDANLLIGGIEDGVLPAAQLNQFRGEGFFMRALAYHHLVRTLGYEPGVTPTVGDGAGWTEGVVLRTEAVLSPEEADFRARSSVSDVYAQIRSDLNEAINLLGQGDAGSPAFATQAAAYALLARVELYAQNFDAANTAAQNALDATDASLASPGEVASMFDETAGLNPEGIFITLIQTAAESQGVNNSLNTYTAQQWNAQVPTQSLMDLYAAGDARLAWYAPCVDDQEGTSCEGSALATHPSIASTGLEIQKWNGEPGNFIDNVPLLRVAEMKLIQAEARLRGSLGNETVPFNELRTARGIATLGSITLDDILDERRREFAAEGQRFYDLKRLGRTIVKDPTLVAGDPAIDDVPFFDFKVLDNLPFSEVALSEDRAPEGQRLVQNPGY